MSSSSSTSQILPHASTMPQATGRFHEETSDLKQTKMDENISTLSDGKTRHITITPVDPRFKPVSEVQNPSTLSDDKPGPGAEDQGKFRSLKSSKNYSTLNDKTAPETGKFKQVKDSRIPTTL